MTVESQIFATQSEASAGQTAITMAEQPMGTRRNGRYKMPTLPGEASVKALPRGAAPWVPGGLQSTTELVSAFAESRALNIWEQEQMLLGLYRNPSLLEEAALLFGQAERAGTDFSAIGLYPELRRALSGGGKRELAEASICGRAKQAAGANEARQAGTNRHTAWEHYCLTGELIGTPAIQEQIQAVARLLADAGLVIIPELSERVIRNLAVRGAGRFDNILLDTRTTPSRLVIADLKTKKKAFWSWMEVDAQLAVYARAEWMLIIDGIGATYEPGPLHHVDLTEGVVLQAPSNGAPPFLRRADLAYGWEVAQRAREIVDMRAYGKSAERMRAQFWGEGA